MAYEQHHAREKYQAQSEKDCIALAVSPEEKHSCEKEAQSRKDYAPWWNVLMAWPEGITTWAIIGTGFVIAWQSNETRRAASAALRSVGVQEAGMGQWVDVEPLGCYIQRPPPWKKDDLPFTINLRFEAVNNTAYTFDIRKIVTKIGMWADEWEVFTVETNVTLASHEKSRNNRYAFYVPTQSITEESFRQGTTVTINGEITFKNCLGKIQTDWFGGVYRCGQIDAKQDGLFSSLETLGIVPERTNEKDNPKAGEAEDGWFARVTRRLKQAPNPNQDNTQV
jgi:hypothetical protein